MRFTCSKAELIGAVQMVTRVLPAQTSEPQFLNVLLSADNGKLELSATQHQLSIRREMPLASCEPGQIAVPGGLFAEILRQVATSRSEGVEFSASESRRIRIVSEGADYKLGGLDPSGFPAMPEPSGERTFELPCREFRDVVRRVAVVTSGGTGPSCDEVLVELRSGELALVATDTVRLAVAKTKVTASSSDLDFRLPLASLGELGKMLPGEGDVRATIGSHQASFHFPSTFLVARMSDRTFPNYRSILPKDHPRYLSVDTKGLTDALRGMEPLGRFNKHRIRLAATAGSVRVSSTSQEIQGDADRALDAELTGEPIELSFNAKYILDFLGVADSEKVRVGLTGPTMPATFRPEGGSADYVYLLMPINL